MIASLVTVFKGISSINKLIDKFFVAWNLYDYKRIQNNYEEKEKEEFEILDAINEAKEKGNVKAIKFLMRERAKFKSE